jgi:hypothetical protein
MSEIVTFSSRRRAQERFYVGRRAEAAEVYVVTRHDVERLRPAGVFAWGAEVERGGAELALAILRHATGREPPEPVSDQFWVEVVASLPHAGFVLGCDDIALWLAAEQRDSERWRRVKSGRMRRRLAAVLAAISPSLTRKSATPVRDSISHG